MLSERDGAFRQKRAGYAAVGFPHSGSIAIGCGFRQAETEDDDQDGRAGAKPVQWPPAVGCGVYESAGEGCSQEVPECITLLQHTGDETASCLRAVFEGSRCCVAVEAAHGDAEEGAAGEELLVGVAETGAELEDDEEDVVDDERPFAAVSVSGDPWN